MGIEHTCQKFRLDKSSHSVGSYISLRPTDLVVVSAIFIRRKEIIDVSLRKNHVGEEALSLFPNVDLGAPYRIGVLSIFE